MATAQLGFAIDSSQAESAAVDLDNMTAAAGRAEAATGRLGKEAKNAATATSQAARAAQSAATANDNAASSYSRHAAAIAQLTAAEARTGGGAYAARAADVAAYGAGLDNLRAKFNPTFAAISQYKAAVMEARQANAVGAISTDEMTAAIQRQRQAALSSIAALKGRGNALHLANDNARRMSGSFSGLGAQFQDIGVTAAMGMNPAIIGLQQGTQMAGQMEMMMQGGTSAVSALAAAFKSLLSPLTIVTIGLTALAAAGLQAVNWVKVGQTSLRAIASVLPEIATGAAIAGAALAVAFAPQILRSVVSLSVALGTGLVSALQAVAAAALANPFVALVVGIGAVIGAAIIFRDDMKQILGVDVVGIAKDAANLVIGSFVASFHDLQFLWKNFPDVISAAATGAANAAISAVNSMVSAAAAGINAVIDLANNIPGVNIGHVSGSAIGAIATPAAGRLSGAVDVRNKQIDADMHRDYVGGIGSAIGSAASMGAGKLRSMASGLGTDSKAAKKAEKEAERQKKAYDDLTRSLEQKTAASRLEIQTLGMEAGAAARLTAEQDALNKAADQHLKLTPKQTEEIKRLADQSADAATELARLKDAYDFGKDTFKGFFTDLKSGLEDGKSAWTSLADAATNALDRIADKLFDSALDNLFDSLFKPSGEGGGIWGAISNLFTPSAKGNVFASAGLHSYANSVVSKPTVFPFARGVGLMGEAGPEAIMPLRRGRDGRLGVAASNDNGGGLTVNINNYAKADVQVQETDDGRGGRQLEVMVRDLVADELSRPGSKSTRALRSRYDLTPRLRA